MDKCLHAVYTVVIYNFCKFLHTLCVLIQVQVCPFFDTSTHIDTLMDIYFQYVGAILHKK